MPGTDICLKIGGWVRAEATDPTNGNLTGGNYTANAQQRQTNNFTERARGYITADARNQTEYGTVRSYIAVGLSTTDIGNGPGPVSTYANRAFIQWAGITAGIAQSFYDFWSTAAVAYRAGEIPAKITEKFEEYQTFRTNKQFIQSDALRKELESVGYEVRDEAKSSSLVKKFF